MRRYLLTLAVLVLAAPAAADARWPRVERAKAAAVEHWGGWPSHCEVVWTLKVDLPGSQGRALTAGPCAIEIDRPWYVRTGRKAKSWPVFCALYVHEWGHLMSRTGTHSEDRRNIMHPIAGTKLNMPAACSGG